MVSSQHRRSDSASGRVLLAVGLLGLSASCVPDRPVEDSAVALQGPARFIFEDATESAGLHFSHVFGSQERYWLPQEMGAGGAYVDFDGDGDLDVFLVQGGEIEAGDKGRTDRLFRNEGDGRFVDVTEGAGATSMDPAESSQGIGCAAADYDGDGDVDIYVTRVGPNFLLRNNGDGTFTDATAQAGVADVGFGAAAAFLDYDRDGLLDLFVVNYVDWSPDREGACFDPGGIRDYCSPMVYGAPAVDILYRGLGDGTFEDTSDTAGITSARGNGLGLAAADFNGDGWTDIYVANDQTPAHLWLNQGDGTFLEDAALSGSAFSVDGMAIAGMGVAARDLDEDGDPDLLVTNIRNQTHLALRNDGGLFTDTSHLWGLASWSVRFTGFGIGLFDQDLDGSLDGIVANGAVNRSPEPYRQDNPYAEPNNFVRRDDRGAFHDAGDEAGPALERVEMSRSVLLGDIDGDGDIDPLITSNRGPVQLLRNENESGHSWTLLDLTAGGEGSGAFHSKIEVQAGGRTFHGEIQPSSGYLGSNDPRFHLGLGEAVRIDRLDIQWPDGERKAWLELPSDTTITIRRKGPAGTR